MEFSDWLRIQLQDKGWTNAELARRVGVSQTYIGNLVRGYSPNTKSGKARPSVAVVDRMAKALNIPLDEARLVAGYAPQLDRPVSAKEAIELIRRMIPGFEGLLLSSGELTDERAEEILEDFRRIAKLHLRIGD